MPAAPEQDLDQQLLSEFARLRSPDTATSEYAQQPSVPTGEDLELESSFAQLKGMRPPTRYAGAQSGTTWPTATSQPARPTLSPSESGLLAGLRGERIEPSADLELPAWLTAPNKAPTGPTPAEAEREALLNHYARYISAPGPDAYAAAQDAVRSVPPELLPELHRRIMEQSRTRALAEPRGALRRALVEAPATGLEQMGLGLQQMAQQAGVPFLADIVRARERGEPYQARPLTDEEIQSARQLVAARESVNPLVRPEAPWYEKGAIGAAEMAPMIAGAVAVGSTGVGLAGELPYWFTQFYPESYNRGIEEGMSSKTAAATAAVSASLQSSVAQLLKLPFMPKGWGGRFSAAVDEWIGNRLPKLAEYAGKPGAGPTTWTAAQAATQAGIRAVKGYAGAVTAMSGMSFFDQAAHEAGLIADKVPLEPGEDPGIPAAIGRSFKALVSGGLNALAPAVFLVGPGIAVRAARAGRTVQPDEAKAVYERAKRTVAADPDGAQAWLNRVSAKGSVSRSDAALPKGAERDLYAFQVAQILSRKPPGNAPGALGATQIAQVAPEVGLERPGAIPVAPQAPGAIPEAQPKPSPITEKETAHALAIKFPKKMGAYEARPEGPGRPEEGPGVGPSLQGAEVAKEGPEAKAITPTIRDWASTQWDSQLIRNLQNRGDEGAREALGNIRLEKNDIEAVRDEYRRRDALLRAGQKPEGPAQEPKPTTTPPLTGLKLQVAGVGELVADLKARGDTEAVNTIPITAGREGMDAARAEYSRRVATLPERQAPIGKRVRRKKAQPLPPTEGAQRGETETGIGREIRGPSPETVAPGGAEPVGGRGVNRPEEVREAEVPVPERAGPEAPLAKRIKWGKVGPARPPEPKIPTEATLKAHGVEAKTSAELERRYVERGPPSHEVRLIPDEQPLGRGTWRAPRRPPVARDAPGFREFLRTVPEFKLDPVFTVTADGGLRYTDGGTFKFTKPEILGLFRNVELKEGDTVRVDPEILKQISKTDMKAEKLVPAIVPREKAPTEGKPAPTRTERARSELDAAIKDLGEYGKGRVFANPLGDPHLLRLASNVVRKAVKLGVYRFADFIERMSREFGTAAVQRMGALLGHTWDQERISDDRLDAATAIEPILKTIGDIAPPVPRGRPELANVGVTPEVRAGVTDVDQLRNLAGLPSRRPEAVAQMEADVRLQMVEQEKQRLLVAGRTGAQLGDTDTLVARQLIQTAGMDAITSGDPQRIAEFIALNDAYRDTGTTQARGFAARRDPVMTPEERLGLIATEALLAPSVPVERDIAKARAIEEPNERAAKLQEAYDQAAAELKDILDRLKLLGIDEKILRSLTQSMPDAAKVIRAVSGMKRDWPSILTEYWTSAILSGMDTQKANVLGNFGFATSFFTIERLAAATIADLMRAGGFNLPMAPTRGEIPFLWKGLLPALSQGWADMLMTFKTEMPAFELRHGRFSPEKAELRRRFAIGGKTGRVIRVPLRGLSAADQAFASAAARIEAGAVAFRIAKGKKLSGDALSARMQELLLDPNSPAWQEAIQTSRTTTFRGPPTVAGQAVLRVKKALWPLHFIVPFVSTFDNIFRQAGRRTIFATPHLINEMWKAHKSGDWSKVPQRAAEQFLAWATFFGAGWAIARRAKDEDPFLTGTDPPPGLPQNSFRIPFTKRWISYGRLEPFATILGLTIDANEALRRGDPIYMVKGLGRQFVNKTFLHGISDIVTMAQQPEGKLQRWLGDFASSWVPNIATQTARTFQSYWPQRRTWGKGTEPSATPTHRALQKISMGAMPTFPRYDWLGQINDKGPGLGPKTDILYRLISPIETHAVSLHPGYKMLGRWNTDHPDDEYRPEEPPPSYTRAGKTVYMTEEQYANFERRAGEETAGIVARYVANASKRGRDPVNEPTVRDLDNLRDFIATGREIARNEIIAENLNRELSQTPTPLGARRITPLPAPRNPIAPLPTPRR